MLPIGSAKSSAAYSRYVSIYSHWNLLWIEIVWDTNPQKLHTFAVCSETRKGRIDRLLDYAFKHRKVRAYLDADGLAVSFAIDQYERVRLD